jgi:GTPase SAR1 family protein
MADIQLYGKDRVPKVLVGNKLDLEDRRDVTVNEAKELQSKADIKVILETSALTGANVERAFVELARQLVADRIQEQPTVSSPNRMNANAVASERKKKCSLL